MHSAQYNGRQALLHIAPKIFSRIFACGIFNLQFYVLVNSNYIHCPFDSLHDRMPCPVDRAHIEDKGENFWGKNTENRQIKKRGELVEANPSKSFGQVDLLSLLGLYKHESFLASVIKQKLIAQQGSGLGWGCVWGSCVRCNKMKQLLCQGEKLLIHIIAGPKKQPPLLEETSSGKEMRAGL